MVTSSKPKKVSISARPQKDKLMAGAIPKSSLMSSAELTPTEIVIQEELKKKRMQEELSQKLISELIVNEELEDADDETKKLAKQAGGLEVIRKKELEFFASKEKKFEEASQAYLKSRMVRQRKEEIIWAKPSLTQQGMNVQVQRKGVPRVFTLKNVKSDTLGPTEWIEIYKLVKDNKTPVYDPLIKMAGDSIKQTRRMETKYKVQDSLLSAARHPYSPPQQPRSGVKRTASGLASSSLPRALSKSDIGEESSLNLRMPSRLLFAEGYYSEDLGGFCFTNVHGHELFFKTNELSIAPSGFLVKLRKYCSRTSNNPRFMQLIDQELMKSVRQQDKAYIEAKQESLWE